jgi:ppGpp synthetase/RelA/SpoT-type nucleotidyltranferase
MLIPPNDQIEQALLTFRIGRRVVLRRVLSLIVESGLFADPFLMLSRLFIRIKSADSIAEKIRRKGLTINSADEIPGKMPDILGVRVITEDLIELQVFRELLESSFRVEGEREWLTQVGDFGQRGLEYRLCYEAHGTVYPFELQLRTFLQHYWAAKSFHLFHKKPREVAEKYRDDLTAFGELLHRAEAVAQTLKPATLSAPAASASWENLPLWRNVNLIAVAPGEQFKAHVSFPLSFNDSTDHAGLVKAKVEMYSTMPGCAIVECSCLSFLTLLMNEPHIRVPMNHAVAAGV